MSDLARFRDLLEKARWPLVCAGVAVLLHMRLMLIAVALPVLVYWHSQTQPDPNEEEQGEEGPYDEEPLEEEDEDFVAGPPRGVGGPSGARQGMGGGKLGKSSASPNDMDFDTSFGLDLNDPLGLDDTPTGPPAKTKASSSSVLSSLGLDDESCPPVTGKPKSGGGGSFLGGGLFGGSNSKADGGSGGLDFLSSSLDMDDNDDLLGGFGGMDGGGGFGGRSGGKGKGGKMGGGGKGGGKDGKGGKGEGFSRDPDPKQVFVAGVGDWPEDQIRSFFEDVGEVTRVKVLTHADGQPKGVCFVTFATEALAQAALRLDGAEIHDKRLIVRQAHGSKGDNKGGGKGGLGRSGDSFPSRDLGSRLPGGFGDGERRGGFGDGGRGGFGDGERRGGFGDGGERRGGFGDGGERRGGFGDGGERRGGFGDGGERRGGGFGHDGDRMGGGSQIRRERSGERGQKERDKPSSEIEVLLQEALDEEDGPLKLEDFDQGSKRFLTELMLKDRINGTRRSVEALEMVFKQCRQKQRDSVRKWRAYTFTLLQKFDPELSDEIAQKRLLERDAERKQGGSKGGPARDGKRDKDTDAPGQSDIKRAWDFAPAESEGRQVLDRWGKPVLL